MANPQTENGYTMIANELLEALARIRLSGEETQVFFTILRKTYGFKKKGDHISLSQFVLSTGIMKPNICRALSKLITKKMIIKTDNDNITSYSIQKDYTRWKPLSKLIMLSKTIIPLIKTDNQTVINIDTHKRNKNTKETLTKEKEYSPEQKSSELPPPKINFNFNTRKWEHIKEKDLSFWAETYPACDIKSEIKRMAAWLIANPKKRKSNYWKFINSWLIKSQDSGGTKGLEKKSRHERMFGGKNESVVR